MGQTSRGVSASKGAHRLTVKWVAEAPAANVCTQIAALWLGSGFVTGVELAVPHRHECRATEGGLDGSSVRSERDG